MFISCREVFTLVVFSLFNVVVEKMGIYEQDPHLSFISPIGHVKEPALHTEGWQDVYKQQSCRSLMENQPRVGVERKHTSAWI